MWGQPPLSVERSSTFPLVVTVIVAAKIIVGKLRRPVAV
jgi:hypothetical protein